MQKLFYSLFTILFCSTAHAQYDPLIYIHVANDTFINNVIHNSDGTVIPIFKDAGINNILNDYTFTRFEPAFPSASTDLLRHFYTMRCNDTSVAQRLHDNYPDVFSYYEIVTTVPLDITGLKPSPAIPALSPNPAYGTLYIKPAEQVAAIQAFDITGRSADIRPNINEHSIDITSLPEGHYYFRLQYADGLMATQQVLVQQHR